MLLREANHSNDNMDMVTQLVQQSIEGERNDELSHLPPHNITSTLIGQGYHFYRYHILDQSNMLWYIVDIQKESRIASLH
jgi:hypothetical protein